MKRRGFTLFELVIVTASAATLLVGIGAVLSVATRALPANSGQAGEAWEFARAVELIQGDLLNVSRVREAKDGRLVFDIHDEKYETVGTITYDWNGPTGYLKRDLDGGGRGPVMTRQLTDATFNVELRRETVTYTPDADVSPIGSIQLATSEENLLGVVVEDLFSIVNLSSGATINGGYQMLQEVTPPSAATSAAWSMSGVRISVGGTGGTDGWLAAEVVALDEFGEPTGAILGSRYLTSAELTYASPQDFTIPTLGATDLPPGLRVGVLLRLGGGATESPGEPQTHTYLSQPSGAQLRYRQTSTDIWQTRSNTQLEFRVYGATAASPADETVTSTRAAAIDLSVTFADSGNTRSTSFILPWPVEANP